MTEVITVKFKDGGKGYYFDPNGVSAAEGDKVVVETQTCREIGTVCEGITQVEDDAIVKPLCKVLRLANERDFARLEENRQKEKSAFEICEKKIEKHGLVMKLVSVEYSFDASRIVFYFTADGRVDFRELVKDLASEFHTRIELRQIGVRDEAKMLGGLGICGLPYCCKQFLHDFQTVSIKMAKEQGLSLNPTKVSGSCGRLMCCLKYEQNAYEHLASFTPKLGAVAKTEQGIGTVVDVNLITGNLLVKLADSDAFPIKVHRDDVKTADGQRTAQKPHQKPTEKEKNR